MREELLTCVFFCRNCRGLRRVYEGYREKRVMPEGQPRLDLVTWCCSACREPIVEVAVPSGR